MIDIVYLASLICLSLLLIFKGARERELLKILLAESFVLAMLTMIYHYYIKPIPVLWSLAGLWPTLAVFSISLWFWLKIDKIKTFVLYNVFFATILFLARESILAVWPLITFTRLLTLATLSILSYVFAKTHSIKALLFAVAIGFYAAAGVAYKISEVLFFSISVVATVVMALPFLVNKGG